MFVRTSAKLSEKPLVPTVVAPGIVHWENFTQAGKRAITTTKSNASLKKYFLSEKNAFHGTKNKSGTRPIPLGILRRIASKKLREKYSIFRDTRGSDDL